MASGFNLEGKSMTFQHDHFTMSYNQARDYGIDYREFEKVDRLPEGIPLVAVAGVWGDYSNIRCLFIDEGGNGYCRNINGRSGEYVIREMDMNAKELEVGQVIVLGAPPEQL